MQDFQAKVAVITGGASGIGFGLAAKAASEGMRVVIADVEEEALAGAEERLKASGASILAVPTDVSKYEQVEALADRAFDVWGAVHLLCNNAGVNLPVARASWHSTIDDWRWVTGVNLWGVIHGVRAFVPRMLEAGEEGHVVNTSSSVGTMSGVGLAPYKLTKHAVLSLTETLAHELVQRGVGLRAHVLCPSLVATGIRASARNRPAELGEGTERTREEQEAEDVLGQNATSAGATPAQVAQVVFDALRTDKLYIFTNDDPKKYARRRYDEILAEVQPQDPMSKR